MDTLAVTDCKEHLMPAQETGTRLLRPAQERDLYPNETLNILIETLQDAAERATQDSRRQHILKSLLAANPLENPPTTNRREQLKKLLRDYRVISAKIQSELKSMGFTVTTEGKHIKLVFHGDDRYTFTLPKSGSDHRGGLNAASDIARLLF